MCKILAISNRSLTEDYFSQIEKIASLNIPIVLREKDLSKEEYTFLAKKVLKITDNVILHTYIETAIELNHRKIHLPMHLLSICDMSKFDMVGVSVHSLDEAIKAQSMGAAYITAGHIFATDCKKDLKPRGIDFLREICNTVNIPVFAIGGITPQNAPLIFNAGASGICLMSSIMKAENLEGLIEEFRKENI